MEEWYPDPYIGCGLPTRFLPSHNPLLVAPSHTGSRPITMSSAIEAQPTLEKLKKVHSSDDEKNTSLGSVEESTANVDLPEYEEAFDGHDV